MGVKRCDGMQYKWTDGANLLQSNLLYSARWRTVTHHEAAHCCNVSFSNLDNCNAHCSLQCAFCICFTAESANQMLQGMVLFRSPLCGAQQHLQHCFDRK